MSTKTATFSVRLTDDVRTQVDDLARATKRSRSFIVNAAVEQYVRERAEYMREIDEALTSAKSGIGHSAEQVFDWIDRWADGEKHPLPMPDIQPKS